MQKVAELGSDKIAPGVDLAPKTAEELSADPPKPILSFLPDWGPFKPAAEDVSAVEQTAAGTDSTDFYAPSAEPINYFPTTPTFVAPAADPKAAAASDSLEDVTEKYGLEVGLFNAVKKGVGSGDEEEKKGSMAKAKDLLKKYGGAYLLTSTSLAVVSFSLCYFLIDNGVDVGALLGNVGIEVDSTSETVGTVSIAYAIHKAASPIRFPPTVALTPIVAKKVFGREEPAEEA